MQNTKKDYSLNLPFEDLIDQIDPDPGNDWELEVEFIILVPVILEVGML